MRVAGRCRRWRRAFNPALAPPVAGVGTQADLGGQRFVLRRNATHCIADPAIDQRQPIIGGGAGTGISAKCEEAAGIDLIVIYNSGRYRMAGRGSLAGLLAYGNANEIVCEMAREVLPVVREKVIPGFVHLAVRLPFTAPPVPAPGRLP